MSDPDILHAVQEQYGAVARSRLSSESAAVRPASRSCTMDWPRS